MNANTSQAVVNLTVNGQQPLQTLQKLRETALNLESAIAKAAAAGNRVDLKKLRKELTDTKKQIREMESSTMQVENVLKSLDRATPKELQKTLQNLNRQLEYIERGSKAWDEQVAKIKKVKAEIATINTQMREQDSFATRLNKTFNEWSTTIMGAAAAMTGLVMAGRSAVSAYADMDEELTNTQKYTGLARDKVEELNESFKKMNTRTSRDQLNELAQEAGRLGKNTIEDVQGYVEAADIINVALVDLGEGATQTIAKLSNIFGIEKLMGTKDAMLAVGSTVNVLSQNCTAGKQYLVEFAQRMAGIGAQAQMTIPEIIAFGAVLDANGQKSEMASSALGKLTMMLFQDPAKMASQVGLEVEKFTETMKRSTTEGLIMFLEKIQQLGSQDGLAVLAPLFKDLGMDGVRMSQVLATLAAHLDEVKWQVGEANKAFSEAKSATGEYDLFNNTVQAGLGKAKKHMSELAIELGEKLLPVMRHVYSSSSLMLRLLNTMVTFIQQYGADIVQLTAIILAYNVGIRATAIYTKAAAVATAAWNIVTGLAKTITVGYTAAMDLCTDAVAGCSLANQRLTVLMTTQNVVTKLLTATTLLMRAAYFACTLQFSAMSATLKSLYVVMASNPYGVILTALTAIGVAIYRNIEAKKERQRQIEEERRVEREQMKEYTDASARIRLLTSIINDNSKSLQNRRTALEQLKKIVPGYNADLTDEGKLIHNNTNALSDYLKKLKEVIRMKANREKLENLYKQEQELEGTERTQSDKYWNIRQTNTLQGRDRNSFTSKVIDGWNRLWNNEDTEAGSLEALTKTQRELTSVRSQISALEKIVVPEPEEPVEKTTLGGGEGGGSHGGGSGSSGGGRGGSTDKFAAEKQWKEQQEAQNRIDYARGEKDYEAYTKRIDEIAVEFYRKELEHKDLSATEKLDIQAQYYEALKKQENDLTKLSLEEEEDRYNNEQAILKQRYVDGVSTTEQYENAIHQSELEHMRRMVLLTKEGTDERLKAEQKYMDALVSDQKKKQQEVEKLAKEHQDKLKKIKEEVFGMSQKEREAAYMKDLTLLTEVYNKEIELAKDNASEKLRIEKAFQKAKLALQKEYNIESQNENRNFLKNWENSINRWLEGEGGQAFMGTMETLVSGMSSIFSELTSLVQSEADIQTAAIESKYEAELSACEGNAYMEKQVEEKKEEELAQTKNEANRKAFAMEVIQAVAQTATSAINAYSSAAAIPMVGWIIAPLAAAAAVAAGAIQIAALKKQQQASEAQGYAEGGFTPQGSKYEEVGVVHAGEWVASQELLANPKARAIINILDDAQRNNRIGSIGAEDVSQTITAPVRIAQQGQRIVTQQQSTDSSINRQMEQSNSTLVDYSDTMRKLNDRLSEPFITINTVEGDHGIKQAQDEYDRLIANKTPKSRR